MSSINNSIINPVSSGGETHSFHDLCLLQNAAVFHGADVQHLQTEVVVH